MNPSDHPSPRPDPSPPPTPAPRELIRLRGPADVVATLPYHLGYQPTASLVLVGLHGPAGTRLGFVARVDLPGSPDEVWPTADALVPLLLAQHPRRMLFVAYEDASPAPGSSEALSRAVRDLVRDAGVEVAQRLVVREGRYWSPDCHPSCCPDEGMPVPAPTDVPAVADYVLLGRSPLRHRDDLARLVTPPTDTDDHEDERRRDAVVELGRRFQDPGSTGLPEGHGPRLVGGETRCHPLRDWGLAAWRSLLTPQTTDDGPDDWSPSAPAPPHPGRRRSRLTSPPDLGVLLAASLRDVALRDLVITWLCPGSLDVELLDPVLVSRAREVLPGGPPDEASVTHRVAALCRATPSGTAAAPLTVLANLVWWHGDGALARTALDLALAQEPGYRLAVLLERMLDLAIPPRHQVA
ncbi:MAG: DUF4192 domain-containing protein [Actinomycetota bacterium]|nr:DUF4192 domain-containing protein [Actinomycetota bacterium]